ncbi:tyrosine-protein phosphatase [Herbidospora sp. NBRC 101105]|uniref:tyrosine-protein phosphatase n=1 Tax=Herbidospora sp. NBRC 101105 TaxID=3032195 RepID=UPI002556F62A|nr:tyrosine-protein phosphatase [Herbidospora sp. NBRC 101105]
MPLDEKGPFVPHLSWEGCHNTRDLGGLPLHDGGQTPFGALIRSDNPERLTAAGWAAAVAHGVRTVVDLREVSRLDLRPADVTTVRIDLDDMADEVIWNHIRDNELDGTPLYYRYFLEAKPAQCVAVATAVARAPEGGVLIHCELGRDRTGLIAMLLLSLAGVTPEAIAEDYALSTLRLVPLYAAWGIADQTAEIEQILRTKGTTLRAAVYDALDGFDAEKYLLAAGMDPADVTALKTRLTRP